MQKKKKISEFLLKLLIKESWLKNCWSKKIFCQKNCQSKKKIISIKKISISKSFGKKVFVPKKFQVDKDFLLGWVGLNLLGWLLILPQKNLGQDRIKY